MTPLLSAGAERKFSSRRLIHVDRAYKRAAKLPSEPRSKIARNAFLARWEKAGRGKTKSTQTRLNRWEVYLLAEYPRCQTGAGLHHAIVRRPLLYNLARYE